MLTEYIKREARQALVPIDLRDVANQNDSLMMHLQGQALDWLQNELALDGIKLICDEGRWYVGPLDA